MKKITALLFTIVFILTAFLGTAQAAAPTYDGKTDANAIMLVDAKTGKVLFEKNPDGQVYPASTTKILTTMVVLENADLNQEVKVGAEGEWTNTGYSLLKTKNGEKIKIKDLLYGMMIVSGDDAASTLALTVGGSEEHFVQMMNETAQRIGMTHSHFVNPHGTDTDGQHVTASDMAKLAVYAMQNETFRDIVGRASYDMPKTNKNPARTVKNTNKLLLSDDSEYYKYATGIKTGSTPKAFRCLVSSAKKGDMELICLTYGDETQNGTNRWPIARDLFEFGFKNFRTVDMKKVFEAVEPVSVSVQNAADGTDTLSLNVENAGGEYQTFDKTLADKVEAGDLKSKVSLTGGGETLNAPVGKGDEVGTVDYIDDEGNVVYQGKLVASGSVEAAGEASAESTSKAQPSGNQSQTTPAKQDGMGVLGWILIAVGAVLLAALAILVVLIIMRKRRYARRRAVRRRRR